LRNKTGISHVCIYDDGTYTQMSDMMTLDYCNTYQTKDAIFKVYVFKLKKEILF